MVNTYYDDLNFLAHRVGSEINRATDVMYFTRFHSQT